MNSWIRNSSLGATASRIVMILVASILFLSLPSVVCEARRGGGGGGDVIVGGGGAYDTYFVEPAQPPQGYITLPGDPDPYAFKMGKMIKYVEPEPSTGKNDRGDDIINFFRLTCNHKMTEAGNRRILETYEDVDFVKGIRYETVGPVGNTSGIVVSNGKIKSLLPNASEHYGESVYQELLSLLNGKKILMKGGYDTSDGLVPQFAAAHMSIFVDTEIGLPKLYALPYRTSFSGTGAIHKGNEVVEGFDEPGPDQPATKFCIGHLDGTWETVGPMEPGVPHHWTCEKRNGKCACCQPPCDEDPPATHVAFIVPPETPPDDHRCYEFPDLKKAIRHEPSDPGPSKTGGGNGNMSLTLVFKDRTPPRILDTNKKPTPDFRLPKIGVDPWLVPQPPLPPTGPNRATTGDWFRPTTELIALDNAAEQVKSIFGIGMVDGPGNPAENWIWTGETPAISANGQSLNSHLFLPNQCLGEMKYTLFLWDTDGNLNPGEGGIVEDDPGNCYHLRYKDARSYYKGLGTTPDDAADFPCQAPGGLPDIEERTVESEGTVFVDDNDFPNFLVKLSTKVNRGMQAQGGETMYFPLPATDTTKVKSIDISAYTDFIQDPYPPELYFTPIHVDLSNCHPKESTWNWKIGLGNVEFGVVYPHENIKPFVMKHFTLENYVMSDNSDSTGDPIDGDEATFGERNGFGKSALLYCQRPLLEDVEYEVSMWAEDNVKWISNAPSDAKDRSIPAPYTGIKEARFVIKIPNNSPPVEKEVQLKDQFVSEPVKVVFREPTPRDFHAPPFPIDPVAQANLERAWPSIVATARDYKGNERSLQIFFAVSDEKTRIRVLEQRHLKN